MLRYYQFLKEMPTLLSTDTIGKERKHTDLTYLGRFEYKYDKKKKIGDYNNDYEVHKHGNYGTADKGPAAADTAYSLYHKPTKNYHMLVQGRQRTGSNHFNVSYLQGHPQSQVKAHDFYHHLITQHGLTINSDADQSEGGMKTWHKLTQKPDINVTHHDISDKEIPLHKDFEKNYRPEPFKSPHGSTDPEAYVKAFSTFKAQKRLTEMPTMLSWLGKVKAPNHVDANPMYGLSSSKQIGSYNHDYAVEHDVHKPIEEYNDLPGDTYRLVDRATGDTHLSVHGYHTGESSIGGKYHNTFNIKYVEGAEASKVKAHDFYHHLITQHGLNLRSDVHQSEGGAKIWKNLSAKPDIDITHHDMHGNQLPLDRNKWDHNYTAHEKPENTLSYSHFIARKKQ